MIPSTKVQSVVCLGEALIDRLGPPGGDPAVDRPVDDRLGGAPANVACGLARLGTPVAFAGRLGQDAIGAAFSRLFVERGVETALLQRDAERPSRIVLVRRARDGERQFQGFAGDERAGFRLFGYADRVDVVVLPDALRSVLVEQGVLGDPDQMRRQVKRLLQSEDAKNQSRQFIVQWLDLDRLASMRPDNQRFPAWTDALAADMRQETIDVFMDLVWKQNKPLSSLLNAQFTYLTPELAEHYGIPSLGPGRQRYDVAEIPSRGGLLTHASVLTMRRMACVSR